MYIHVVTHDSMAPTLTVLSILPPRWSWRTRAVRLASRRFHLLSHLPSVYRMVTVTGCPRPSGSSLRHLLDHISWLHGETTCSK